MEYLHNKCGLCEHVLCMDNNKNPVRAQKLKVYFERQSKQRQKKSE
jgi:hypothetical protein